MLEELAIKFISWNLKRKGINTLEIVIRSDGNTVYKRNKEKEEYVKKILSKIKWNYYEIKGEFKMLERIYEKITGRCWHVYSKMPENAVLYKCLKCEKVISK